MTMPFGCRCVHCRAYHYERERGRDAFDVNGVPGKSFLMCCQHGKVSPTPCGRIPVSLADLIDGVDVDRSRLFFKSPRTINNCLALGSWPITEKLADGRQGMYCALGTAFYKYDPCMFPAEPDKAHHIQVMHNWLRKTYEVRDNALNTSFAVCRCSFWKMKLRKLT